MPYHSRLVNTLVTLYLQSEEYHVDQSGINFSPISSVDTVIAATKSLLPKASYLDLLFNYLVCVSCYNVISCS